VERYIYNQDGEPTILNGSWQTYAQDPVHDVNVSRYNWS